MREIYLDNRLEEILKRQEIKAREERMREIDEDSSSIYDETNDFQPSGTIFTNRTI